jgi:hypothetical protein
VDFGEYVEISTKEAKRMLANYCHCTGEFLAELPQLV